MYFIWLRRDLRLIDNLCFEYLSNKRAANVLIYHQIESDLSDWGVHRKKFYLESLEVLNKHLEPHGNKVNIGYEAPEKVLNHLGLSRKVSEILYTKSFNSIDIEKEKSLKDYCRREDLVIRDFDQMTLLSLDDLPFPLEELPKTFTPFRKKVEPIFEELEFNSYFPKEIPRMPDIHSAHFLNIKELKNQIKEVDDSYFLGGESEGIKRLKHYFWVSHSVKSYKETRNGLLNFDDSTKFSPWLALGSLSPRTIYNELKHYEEVNGANESTYWVFFELLWRDYFKFLALKYGPKFFQKNGIKTPNMEHPENQNELFEDWCQGRTGSNFVDANMTELKTRGWMSNRGRQNVASYLAKHIHLDWTLGAKWFEKNLVDFDPESNWGNWAYNSGAGVDPRDRKFDIVKQANTYDPESEYQKKFLSERF